MARTPVPPPEEGWSPARLIPVVGMKGVKEQEQRATSALLAVMQVVPSFGKALLKYLGFPAGRISTFTEPHFNTDEGGTAIPDGAIVVEWGVKRWVCLVEVKTGNTDLQADQVDRYLRIAAGERFDAVLTISNQIVSSPDDAPVAVDRRRLKTVRLRHLSWFRIFTEAVIQREHHGIVDPEQAKVLDDLMAFLDDERSGAGGYQGMGKSWVTVRDAVRNHTLHPSGAGVTEVAEGWEQFVEYLCLRLRQDLGHPVAPVYPRASTHKTRIAGYIKGLGDRGRLEGSIKVTDAVGPIGIVADIRASQATTSVTVAAPKEGRPKTQINWLLRQLKGVPSGVRVEARYPHSKQAVSALVEDALRKPDILLLGDDPHRTPSSLEVALTRSLGMKQGKGRGSFVAATVAQVLDFYGDVVQDLQNWTPRPPKLPEEAKEAAQEDSTPTPRRAIEIGEGGA